MQTVRVQKVRGEAGGIDWVRLCRVFGVTFRISVFIHSDGMLLRVERKAPQHQIRILRSLAVWRKTSRWENCKHGAEGRG